MITETKARNAHLLSAWATGIAMLFLGIGLHGTAVPLLSSEDSSVIPGLGESTVMVESFEPPAPADNTQTEPETKEVSEDMAIPPLPETTPPLTPPEMIEIAPVAEVRDTTPSKLIEKKTETRQSQAKPAVRPLTNPQRKEGGGEGGTGAGTSPILFKGGGSGRFPAPSYPASARTASQQGTVRLLVTVEANGIPSFIEVTGSSGFASLDNAARDTIQRRWRWPSGGVRKFFIPVRFVLQ
ncbi:MAG: hypothetical protein RL693_1290 [Verrucomicrobiota bacterium]|jgi:TonB family protein